MKICYTSILLIWITSMIVTLIAVLAQILELWDFYFYYRYVKLHVFRTIPIICIILMYIKLVWTLNKRSNEVKISLTLRNVSRVSDNGNSKKLLLEKSTQKMTLMVKRVVLVLIVCYVPYLMWMQYYYVAFSTRIYYKVHDYEVML